MDSETVPGLNRFRDYLSLTKPRINFLVLITAFLGAWMGAQGSGSVEQYGVILAGTGLTVAGASVFNCYQEREVDARMERTRSRPLPSGRIEPEQAFVLGGVCATFGLTILAVLANGLSACLAFVALVVYSPIYTWMKSYTSLATIVGSVPGALPPVIGWAGMTGSIGYPAVLLFLIMFVWQPPHFLALALYQQEDYDRADLAMLPIEINEAAAVRQIVIYTSALLPLSLLPVVSGLAGELYFIVALGFGLGFLALGLLGLRGTIRESELWSKGLFVYSIAHLTVLFVTLAVESGGTS